VPRRSATLFAIWSRQGDTWPIPCLGGRLRNDVRLMIRHKDKSALEILGSPDDLKFRSCLTLFRQAASEASDGRGTGLIKEKWETLVG
jgi:uncharacterized protein (DUF1810 family)